MEKTVKMEVKNNDPNKKEGKLTYEQLNDACSQLYQQNQNLVKQLQHLNQVAMYKRLDYLFMVVQYADTIGDTDFVNNCIDEIKAAITINETDEPEQQ